MNITTLKKLSVALNQIFKYAVRHQYIDGNPVANAERPKDQRAEDEKEFIQVLTENQITLLLEAWRNIVSRFYFSWLFFQVPGRANYLV